MLGVTDAIQSEFHELVSSNDFSAVHLLEESLEDAGTVASKTFF